MLGTDKSRGYCLEMICADFLAGAHLDNGNPEILLQSLSRYYGLLPSSQKQAFFEQVAGTASEAASNSIRMRTGNSTDRCLSARDGVVSCAEACAAYRCITFRFAVMQATMMSGISLHFANLATIVFTIRKLSPCEKLPLREANPSHSSFLTEQATGLRLSPQSVSVVPHSFNHIVAPSVKTNTWPENGLCPLDYRP